jgi:gag-polypeptide of LTR copia-type
MWQILKEVCESSGWENRMTLLREYISLKMDDEGIGMQEHINHFT